MYTKRIETDWVNPIEPYTGGQPIEDDEEAPQKVVVEIGGRRVEVSLPGDLALSGGGGGGAAEVRSAGSQTAHQEEGRWRAASG